LAVLKEARGEQLVLELDKSSQEEKREDWFTDETR